MRETVGPEAVQIRSFVLDTIRQALNIGVEDDVVPWSIWWRPRSGPAT